MVPIQAGTYAPKPTSKPAPALAPAPGPSDRGTGDDGGHPAVAMAPKCPPVLDFHRTTLRIE
ncbi:MAG TPA: hypothetical protein VI029_20670, partial [Mycobacterium sp.]